MRLVFKAEPQPLSVEFARTALLIIDMQRDFLEPGGFGETLATTSAFSKPRCRRYHDSRPWGPWSLSY
jgi:hypothetical protein